MDEADRRFRFAQFELPWSLGPDDGRYVLRDRASHEPSHVVVLATLGAVQRSRRRRRLRAAKPEPDPTPVPTTRATVIDADAIGPTEAEAWLAGMSSEAADGALAERLEVLNRALRAHRLAAADPSIADVLIEQALVARLGHGRGDQVADGRWSQAVEVPPDRRRRERRVAALRPQERLAALLGGRERALACEELALRARVDLGAGRGREAALQLRVAVEAALAELDGASRAADAQERLEELRARRRAVGEAANRALVGELPEEALIVVEQTLGRLEAALRARAAAS